MTLSKFYWWLAEKCSSLQACENLSLFQKYQIEAEVGKYLHLFEKDSRRLEDVLGM